MKATEFKTCMDAFNRMIRGQRDTLRKQLQGKVAGDEGMKLIEQSLADVSACPHCGGTELYRWGNSCDLQRYRCRHCQCTFNALTHTPLARLRHKDKWLNYERAMVQVLSIRQAAASCGIAKITSFKWRHRFLSALATQQPAQMNGIVKADETFFLESFKGKRHLSRTARKQSGLMSYSLIQWKRCMKWLYYINLSAKKDLDNEYPYMRAGQFRGYVAAILDLSVNQSNTLVDCAKKRSLNFIVYRVTLAITGVPLDRSKLLMAAMMV